jgi:hypothetical protein
VDACQDYPQLYQHLCRYSGPWWNVLRCALNLVEGMENILSTYYKCTSAITHKLNFSSHMLMLWYVELMPKVCPHLSVTSYMYMCVYIYCNRSLPPGVIFKYQSYYKFKYLGLITNFWIKSDLCSVLL